MGRKTIIPAGRQAEYATRPDAELYLVKAAHSFGDVELIRFASRRALEAFNERANLNALVRTIVPRGMALYRHQQEAQ